MKQKEQSDKLKQLLSSISKSVAELEKGDNVSFYKALLQKQSIELYELAETIDASTVSSPAPHIKIIKQEEVLEPVKTPEPVKITEPIIEKVSLKPEPVAPIPAKEPIQENVIIPPPVEIFPEPIIETLTPEPIIEIPEPVIETRVVETLELPVTPLTPPTPPVPPAPVVPPTPPKAQEPAPTSIVDKKISDDVSLNAKLSMNKQPVVNIAEKSKETPIADLAKAIAISKKFEFIKGLFDGDGEAYKAAISTLQASASYEEAINYIDAQIRSRYDWSDNEDLSAELMSLLKRRFSK